MRSRNGTDPRWAARRGSALVEAAVVLPLILTALFGLVASLQWGLWKLAANAAASAGAAVLAEGQSPAQAETTTLRALTPPPGSSVQVTVEDNGTRGTVSLILRWATPLGALPVTARWSVALLAPWSVPPPGSSPGRGFIP